jgi:hypothetical protein
MGSEVEWGVRSKIADIQCFLTSERCSEKILVEINRRLDHVVAAMSETQEEEVGGKT